MSLYEEYQNKFKKIYLRFLDLQKDAKIEDIVECLIKSGYIKEATELLFGCDENSFINQYNLGFSVFSYFVTGKNTELLLEVVRNYHWVSSPGNEGFAIHVYPNEWFLIEEPTASKVLKVTK